MGDRSSPSIADDKEEEEEEESQSRDEERALPALPMAAPPIGVRKMKVVPSVLHLQLVSKTPSCVSTQKLKKKKTAALFFVTR